MLVIDKATQKILGTCDAQVTGNSFIVKDPPKQDVVFPLVNMSWGDSPASIQTVPAIQADNLNQAQTYLPNFIEYVKPNMA